MKRLTILGILLSICIAAGVAHAGFPQVYLDIKPQSCPNPFNYETRGVLPVAILGSAEFDVNDIDPDSIVLADYVPPLRWSYEDAATADAYFNELPVCPCNDEGPDGFMDLTLKFDSQEVAAAIGDSYDSGEPVFINITFNLYDGTAIQLVDCVVLVGKMHDGPVNMDKVTLCHMGRTIRAGARAVPAHLAHGDYLGACSPD